MILTGFILGFLGSFHCLGMCGPIALAISAKDNNRFLINKIFYNLGRTCTYVILGLIVGTLGFSLQLAGVQQWGSVFLGGLIIFMAFFYKKNENYITGRGFFGLSLAVKKKLGRLLKMGGPPSFFAGGLINGLLPCGMVYIALVASLALQNTLSGALYMFAFVLCTVPMMLGLMLSGKLLSINLREKFLRAMPYLAMFIGVLFILRGSGLGMEYLSPKIQNFVYGAHTVEMTICE